MQINLLIKLCIANSPDHRDDGVKDLLDGGRPIDVIGGCAAGVDDEVSQEGKDDKLVRVLDRGERAGDLVQIASLNKVNVLSLGKADFGVKPLDIGVANNQKSGIRHGDEDDGANGEI